MVSALVSAEIERDDAGEFLARIGARVRVLRAQRGMSRRILAESSAVSERYLAQLEAGKGNISILLLRQVAAAMDVAIGDLLEDTGERSIEYTVLREHLRHAGVEELRRLYDHVMRGRPGTAGKGQRIALIGLRGAGKTTLGSALAHRLGMPFVELAQEIERTAGMGINEILALGGQAAYRRFEKQALEGTLARFSSAVIAAGGSLVSEAESYALLLDACYTVWLQASPEEHMQRVIDQGDYRPMKNNPAAMDDLKRILAERDALYRRAHAVVDTSECSVQQSLSGLLSLGPINALMSNSEEPN